MEIDSNTTWETWYKGCNILRWAYIDDLLPKDKTEQNQSLKKNNQENV